jgi:prevent-host-death family protein
LGQFASCIRLRERRGPPLAADAVAKVAFVPLLVNSASRERMLGARSTVSTAAARRSTKVAYHALPAWKLQDAKARFSQLVREALEHGPQRVTLHGKDAVVILSAEAYGRLAPAAAQPCSGSGSTKPARAAVSVAAARLGF